MRDELRREFEAIHYQTVGEMLHLLDGFYVNLEDGLFELASRTHNKDVLTQSFALTRELRTGRAGLLRNFISFMETDQAWWWEMPSEADDVCGENDRSLRHYALHEGTKRTAHFSRVLGAIVERTAQVTQRDAADVQIPVSPLRLTYNFLRSWNSLETDVTYVVMVQNLYGRFVLDRLGAIYALCNQRLSEVICSKDRESPQRVPPILHNSPDNFPPVTTQHLNMD